MKRLPRTHKELQALLYAKYQEGYTKHREEMADSMRVREEELKRRRAELHLDALKSIRDLASVLGQFSGEISRAMQSEKGQL